MTVHTLTEEWILAYAAGGLNEGQLLVAACHLSFHPELVDAVHEAEAVGGALLSDLPDAEVSPDMLATVLDRLDRPGAAARPVEAARIKGMPDPLTAYIGGGYDRLHWRVLGPGLRHALLWTGPDGQKAWLLRGEGARVIPEHGHSGDEWTLVLKGAYQAQGERFVAGDLEMADPSVHHMPSLDPSEECICLAYTAGRIRPRSPIVRLMQPFIGL